MDQYLSVLALTRYIKARFEGDENLKRVHLKGEISNFKAHTRGHLYFSLKDEFSKINAIMFSSNASKIKFQPRDGMKVLVTGKINVYEATGSYQISVETMEEDGIGNLHIAFEELKDKLNKEGLFDRSHKQPIPKYPKRIGVITASTGAAIRDIFSTINRRYPLCETILFPSFVQGELAKDDIVRNIERAQHYDLDLLIIGRGGGSMEDLWPFNEEAVARAIYHCKIPTISAVGHEIDFTISDFVADLRAETPTAAAEIAVPNLNDLIRQLDQYKIRANEAIMNKLNYQKLRLHRLKNSYLLSNPRAIYEMKSQKLDGLMDKLTTNIVRILEQRKQKYNTMINKLELLNPMSSLKRGYAIVKKNGKCIQFESLKIKDTITIEVEKGTIHSTITELKEEN